MNPQVEVPRDAACAPTSPVDRESWLFRRVTPEQHPLRELLRCCQLDTMASRACTGCEWPETALIKSCTPLARPAAGATAQLDDAELARRIHELPPLPRALTEALRVVRDDALSADGCVRAIEQDATLAARVLRLANSPFYGACGRVSSVCDAVRLLGLRTVAGVVVAVSMRAVLSKWADEGELFQGYWQHAVATANAARELAREAGTDPDEAFLAGLLHDLGRLVQSVFAPASVRAARALALTEDVDPFDAESRLVGRTHDDIGAAVARRWLLPEPIIAAIALHHMPSKALEPGAALVVAVVHVADAIVHAMDLAGDLAEAVPPIDSLAWRLAGPTEGAMPRIVERVTAGVALMTADF